MPKGSKAAQTSLVLKPGTIRPRRLFLHFFDIHFLEEMGRFASSMRATAEMEMAVRFAVILGSEIFVPAASYYENSVASRILKPFLESDVSGLFRFVGGGASLDEFRLDKVEQYRPGSAQHSLYASPLEQMAGWARRERSATKDIASAWISEPSQSEVMGTFRPYLDSAIAIDAFEKLWLDIPERLGNEAFIMEHVVERMPVDRENLTVRNILHGKINRFYFDSYARDYGAAVFQKMTLSGGADIPSGARDDDIDLSLLLKMCRMKEFLPIIRDCKISHLETIPFNPVFQEIFAMSQTDGTADSDAVAVGLPECDLVILTALPKEREAVEVVFGKGKPFRVAGDPQLYKQINLEIAGRQKRIVLAVLPTMGNVRAGVAASNALRSFKTKNAFMVGIAGATPFPAMPSDHVRLGDVVIGQSVLEWDFGKRSADGSLEVRDSGQRLSHDVFQFVANLRSERTSFDTGWLDLRLKALRDFDIDPENLPPDRFYDYQGVEQVHPEDPRRKLSPAIVHFGRVGSGDTLLKDPALRDELRERHGIIAVEMESAGMRDAGWSHNTQVGVIRGIVDYCDDHKDDRWHMIGALSAAAMMRFLYEKMVEAEPE